MEYDPTKLRIRMSPYGLCSFLPSISNEQKRDIIELGFEFLLTLRVDKIPSRLTRWLIENFDTCRQVVKLASNDELMIIEKVNLFKKPKRVTRESIHRYLMSGRISGEACVQKILRSLKSFACSVIEVVDVVSEAQQMFPASIQIDKVQAGTFKDVAGPSQTHPRDANVGHQATLSSQDDGLFIGYPSFWDACVELAKTYEKTSGIAYPGTFTPAGFDLGELTDVNFNITRSVTRTLGYRDELDHGVVDLFAYFLNHSEKLKDPQSQSSSSVGLKTEEEDEEKEERLRTVMEGDEEIEMGADELSGFWDSRTHKGGRWGSKKKAASHDLGVGLSEAKAVSLVRDQRKNNWAGP
ncbi:hypothetical protein Cgig2_010779 [Carnegiea gigantea]|uniref:Uncharacterized protein n=1 Tax=Carnegiea gigantea TaxID=171969 RepID=A0A9Q1GIU1_9CARY|nr:hypothetical protein Cgig2_010779 [Carnegiea gigantea]